MNIFVLDTDPLKAASYHCDKHVVKMVLETAQILCTVANERGFETPYRSTHRNHPCTKWARESFENVNWLCHLGWELANEYENRYFKKHKSKLAIAECCMLFESEPWSGTLNRDFMPKSFAVAMPDFCKISDDPVECYRYYYAKVKKKFAKWKNGTPDWYVELSEKLYGEKNEVGMSQMQSSS